MYESECTGHTSTEIENVSYSDDYKFARSHKCVAQQVVAYESLKSGRGRLRMPGVVAYESF